MIGFTLGGALVIGAMLLGGCFCLLLLIGGYTGKMAQYDANKNRAPIEKKEENPLLIILVIIAIIMIGFLMSDRSFF